MTTDPSLRALLAQAGATEPGAAEIVAEVRTESVLPFFPDPGRDQASSGLMVSGRLAAIIGVTATLPWQRAAQLQDWLTERHGEDPDNTGEAELARFVSGTIFAGTELAGTASYLGTYILAGRAQRTVRLLIGLTQPVAAERYGVAWARALDETRLADPGKFARLRGFLALLLEDSGVTVERYVLLSAAGDLYGHSIATGPSGG